MRSTVPRLVREAVALASDPALLCEVAPLVVGSPDSRAPSSVLGCALVASLRLRFASSAMAWRQAFQSSDFSAASTQIR